MNINISQTPIKLDITRTPFSLEMQSQRANIDLKQNHVEVNIETQKPEVEIDQYESFASVGFKNNIDLIKEAAERGKSKALEYASKKASDGDRLAAIHLGGEPIADMAERESFSNTEVNIASLPSARPQIEVKGYINIDFTRGGGEMYDAVDVDYTPPQQSVEFTPSKINIAIAQYNSISFSYTGNTIDSKI